MKTTFKIIVRSAYTKKDGSFPVYLRVILNRIKKDYSLNVSVPEPKKFWDESKSRAKRCVWIKREQINETIEDAEQKAASILRQMKIENIPLTIHEFDRRFRNPIHFKNSFFQYAQNEINNMVKMKASSETIRSYNSYISKLKQYKPDMAFSEINLDFIKRYHHWMIEKGNLENTCHKSLSWLRTILKRAVRDGLYSGSPFSDYPLKRVPGKRDFLNETEVTRLERIFNEGMVKGYQENVLRCFLFAIQTGLRYSDIRNLKNHHLYKATIGIKEVTMLKITMQKTKNNPPVEIPLTEMAISLIPKLEFKNQKVFRVPTNQVTNRYLKEVTALAGIKKEVSFHVARHTFATISISRDMPLVIVSKILGHTDIKTTQIYAKVMIEAKVRAMELWDHI